MKKQSWKKEFATLILNDATEQQAMDLKIQHFPHYLFRYGRFDDKGFWEAPLLKHQLWLSSPQYFNDAFDCELIMNNTIIEAPFFQQMLKEQVQNKFPHYSALLEEKQFNSTKDLLDWFCDITNTEYSFFRPNHKKLSSEVLTKKILDIFNKVSIGGLKVLCFSEVYDSPIMWAHYANYHHGFCIGYDFMEDTRTKTSGKGGPLFPNIWPVIYQHQRVDFGELCKQGKLASVTNATLFKSREWKYEKEWRLVWSDYYNRIGSYVKDGGCMRVVYLGAKTDMASKNVKRLLRHANHMEVPVFKMQLSDSLYRLIPIQING